MGWVKYGVGEGWKVKYGWRVKDGWRVGGRWMRKMVGDESMGM